jgi:hypothetical protein
MSSDCATRGAIAPLSYPQTAAAADGPVDEAGRIVEIIRGGQQIRVLPDPVAGVATGRLLRVAMISALAILRRNRKSRTRP